MDGYWKLFVMGCGLIATDLFGANSLLFHTLLLFVGVDYITGLLASVVNRRLSSQVGRIGIAKKVMMFAVIATAHLIDELLGGGHLLRDGTITFYLCNELISILENSAQVGIPIPGRLRQAIHILKQKEEEQDGNQTTNDSETV